MKKQIISIITLIVMMISLCSINVMADGISDNEEIRGDFVYIKGTNTITAYVGETGVCEIPEGTVVNNLTPYRTASNITKLIINKNIELKLILSGELTKLNNLKEVEIKEGVCEIPYQAFEHCDALEKITIPSTVTKIDDYAFSNCKSLKTVELPDGLKTIGEYAFSYLPLLSGNITIPDSVTNMGEGVFSYCGDLNKVHLSNNLTYTPIKNNNGSYSTAKWFEHTNVQEINIPTAMLEKPTCNFYADEITFDSDMTVNIYKAVEDSAWCRNKYWKGKTDKSLGGYDGFAIAENTVLRYFGTEKNPVVPEGVKTIGENSFWYCDLDSVTLPKSLEKIESGAFHLSTIKNIVIPKNVESIESNAFDFCPLLEKIIFEGNPEVELNAVQISNRLTEDNLVFKESAPRLKEKIISFGTVEYEIPSFYKLINQNRISVGFKEIPVPEEYKSAESDSNQPQNTAKPQNTEKPQTTDKPQNTVKPSETPAPAESQSSKKLSVQGGDTVTVNVGGIQVIFTDAKPFIDANNRTQVPVRAVSEMLDCDVTWDGERQTVTIKRENDNVIKIVIGSDIMTVDDKQIKMDTAALIKDDRTYIPVRFVAEAMGLTVEWSE